eukprot:3940342-Rhodomonas_salina.1
MKQHPAPRPALTYHLNNQATDTKETSRSGTRTGKESKMRTERRGGGPVGCASMPRRGSRSGGWIFDAQYCCLILLCDVRSVKCAKSNAIALFSSTIGVNGSTSARTDLVYAL